MKEEQKENKAFVEKVGAKKSKKESYLERMQAGKHANIGSKDGAHEL